MLFPNPFAPGFLLRFFGLLLLAGVFLLGRGFLRQARVRRAAREMLAGQRPITEEDLDRCLREIGAAPGYAGDEELLRALQTEREKLRRVEERGSRRGGE